MLFSFVFLSATPGPGQTLEDILATLQIEEESDILTDDELLLLEDLARRPIDVNRATRMTLQSIPLITSSDVSRILEVRRKTGQFTTREEITAISGLSPLAERVLPFVTTVETAVPVNVVFRNRWATSHEDVRILTQATVSRSAISGGFIVERDPNERMLMDFVTGYVTISLSEGTRLIVGDHQLQTGYGLIFGRSVPSIKGYGSLTGMGRPGKGLKPYRSSAEYWALRGAAWEKTGRWGRWIVSLSASFLDATVDSSGKVTVATSGLHLSEVSLARKHNLREDMALVSWQRGAGTRRNWGVSIVRDRWTVDGSTPVNRPGRTYGSVFGQLEHHTAQFFGEVATYSGMQPSFLSGVILSTKNLQSVTSLRRYPRGFLGPRSQPFREWTGKTLNEMGVYQALSVKLGRHRLYTYSDVYRQSASSSQYARPIRGFEVANTWSYRWRGGQASLRWKYEEKSNEPDILYPGEPFVRSTARVSWRLNSSVAPNKQMRFQLQGDRTSATDGKDTFWGHGLSIKTHLVFASWRLSLNWVGFTAEDYLSRIYVWDLNFPGELRNRTFSPTGQSGAFLIRWTTRSGATLLVRVRTTWNYSRRARTWSKPQVETSIQMDIAF